MDFFFVCELNPFIIPASVGEQHENTVSLILTDSSHRLAKRRYAVM